jgi:hypothetical protein
MKDGYRYRLTHLAATEEAQHVSYRGISTVTPALAMGEEAVYLDNSTTVSSHSTSLRADQRSGQCSQATRTGSPISTTPLSSPPET